MREDSAQGLRIEALEFAHELGDLRGASLDHDIRHHLIRAVFKLRSDRTVVVGVASRSSDGIFDESFG